MDCRDIALAVYLIGLFAWVGGSIAIRATENQWGDQSGDSGEWELFVDWWWYWLIGVVYMAVPWSVFVRRNNSMVPSWWNAGIGPGSPRFGNGERRTRGAGGFSQV